MRELRPSMLLALVLVSTPVSALTIDWVTVGDPGNAADSTGFGAVADTYQISKYEITNTQYTEFLNAVAATDTLGLYSVNMGSGTGGITRSGAPGSFTYGTISGRANMPVNFVSFFDSLRFANWLYNGQGASSTETGAYTLLGGTPFPTNGVTVTRNPGASIFLTSENEWYKAAYFDGTSYFDYPAGSDTQTTCAAPTAAANSANCDAPGIDPLDPDIDGLAVVGSFTGSPSPYGTFDQGGNVAEWNESMVSVVNRAYRGGAFNTTPLTLAASTQQALFGSIESSNVGFRVASLADIPEPGTGLLVIAGLIGFSGWRRARA